MDQRTKAELDSIITDLNKIIYDLRSISNELNEFRGIGATLATNKLNSIAENYERVRNNLRNMW